MKSTFVNARLTLIAVVLVAIGAGGGFLLSPRPSKLTFTGGVFKYDEKSSINQFNKQNGELVFSSDGSYKGDFQTGKWRVVDNMVIVSELMFSDGKRVYNRISDLAKYRGELGENFYLYDANGDLTYLNPSRSLGESTLIFRRVK